MLVADTLYPARDESKALRKHTLLTPFLNDRLPLFTATVYGLLLWALASSMPHPVGVDERLWLFSRLDWPWLLHLPVPGPTQLAAAAPFLVAVTLLTGILWVFAKHGVGFQEMMAAWAALLHRNSRSSRPSRGRPVGMALQVAGG